MPNQRKSSKPRIGLEHQLGQNWPLVSFWSRLKPESLNSSANRKLFRDLILENPISTSVPGPYSDLDVIKKVAADAHKPIPIDYLCSELGDEPKRLTRARVLFGYPGQYLDEIANDYSGLYWWLSDKGLRMEILGGDGRLPSFDEMAGQLMIDAKANSNGKYLKQPDYEAITSEIDKAGFLLREQLPKKYREELADWNQKHPNKTIKTFVDAVRAKLPLGLRRGVLRCLYYAEEKLRKRMP